MPVEVIRIHEATWDAAHARRRSEWRTLILDVPASSLWPERAIAIMRLSFDDDGLQIDLYETPGNAPERVFVARAALVSVMTEYLSVIQRLEEDDLTMARAEALDMAKRVVHDDAARTLSTAIPTLGGSFEGHRKLFSLIVALASDTTKTPSAHRHL
jgi:uncharacterized protein (UPF0262 family)